MTNINASRVRANRNIERFHKESSYLKSNEYLQENTKTNSY